MTSYVRKIVIDEEKLLFITRLHWIYLVEAVLWLAIFVIAGLVADTYFYWYAGLHAVNFEFEWWIIRFDNLHTPIPWLFGATGLAIFIPLFIAFIASEIGLTNQRIIYKKGLIFVEVIQLDLEDIRGEEVIHGWLGWLFGYGRIHLDCRFIEDVWLPAIRDPYRLIKASHTARLKHPLITYTEQDLELNMDEIEQRRRKAQAKNKLKHMGEQIKASFQKVN